MRSLSYYSQPLLKMQQVDVKVLDRSKDLFSLDLPFEAQNLHIEINLDARMPMKHISDTIKSLSQSVDTITFYTLDSAIIP